MAKSNEPIWWSLFSAGGMLAAMFLPVLIIITGLVLPLGMAAQEAFAFERVHSAASHPIVKLFLFGLIALTFFHWAHRFRFTLVDIGLQKIRTLISILCYGSAIAVTLITAVVLWGV
ncbi:fumarate reductase subunit D [Acidobacteria bacterium AH-259-G07]|nr:fumarate reductase subunit D [Acidobacteria bacterium AH-259-G07]